MGTLKWLLNWQKCLCSGKRMFCSCHVETLLNQEAIATVSQQQLFQGSVLPFYLVRKKKLSSWRSLTDLRELNTYIRKDFFTMELQPKDWFLSIDLKESYFHIPTAPFFQICLWFAIAQLHYQFVFLPFSLTTLPQGIYESPSSSCSVTAVYAGFVCCIPFGWEIVCRKMQWNFKYISMGTMQTNR